MLANLLMTIATFNNAFILLLFAVKASLFLLHRTARWNASHFVYFNRQALLATRDGKRLQRKHLQNTLTLVILGLVITQLLVITVLQALR